MLVTLMCSLISLTFANGGPVELSEPSVSGGVVLMDAKNISLESEDLEISVLDTRNYSVKAEYVLNSKKKQTVQYGVPIQWLRDFDLLMMHTPKTPQKL